MAGYWLKLYTEILEDPKYHRVSDNAKLGMIELMVVAKRVDMDGEIPSIEDVAFYTRRSVEWWKPVFEELSKIEYLVSNGTETIIRKFSERQRALDSTERSKYAREIKHKKEFTQRPCNDHATKSNGDSETDIDTDKNRVDTERVEKKVDSNSFNPPSKDDVKIWNHALGELRSTMSKADYETWINPLELEVVDGSVFKVRAANKYAADWVRDRCGKVLSGYLSGYNGHPSELEVMA